LTVYDCSLVSDGAAAVVLAAEDKAARFSSRIARVRAVAQTSDSFALADKEDITSFRAVENAARRAYEAAGVGPANVDFAEVHDCFTIAEILATEDLGFVAKGEGGPFAAAGCSRIGGRLPLNASGGLKAKGHPVGATGTGQICDLVTQLRGDASALQVARHRIGLAQNLGGSGGTCVVTILEAA
jgi:acetyl-CoA C-acetyltransferase